MPRLLHDRYLAYDDVRGCDLTTGGEVRLDALPADIPEEVPPVLAEILDDGQDGSPRWIVADTATVEDARRMTRRAAAAARVRGYVPVLVPLYQALREPLGADLAERTLLLIGPPGGGLASARAALLDAAARSPRPHVLLTFGTAAGASSECRVREARAEYVQVQAPSRLQVDRGHSAPDIKRHLERAARAEEFQRSGRHAAAGRLLRDVASTLARRQAWTPAAETLIALGRMLLERGQAAGAERVFGEAASLGPADAATPVSVGARLWQAAARTDADRLSEAESLCRSVLVTHALAADRRAWALALLVRVLCWQGRAGEALRTDTSILEGCRMEQAGFLAATVDAAAIRLLLTGGRIFDAGQRARTLLDRADRHEDPLTRIVALTAHLRVLVATGDLYLAERRLEEVCGLARASRTPLRAVRARLIWARALRRAGRVRESARELERLARMRRVLPPLLRRAIETAAAPDADRPARDASVEDSASPAESSLAARLVHLVFDESSDRDALQRLLGRLREELGATRIDLVSSDAGPASAIMTNGAGLAPGLGRRVLEAGIAIDAADSGREMGVPVRFGARLTAALVCRWALDRQAPAAAQSVLALGAAIAAPRVDALLAEARTAARASTAVPELIGDSAAMADVRRAIERAARAPFAVLIEGDSGVGKELAARAIHQLGPRRERRFCDVNCAALPDELLESELFGHARGAFTGAVVDKPGLFEEADGGTLFLDEVPDLSPRGQAKLLRVIQQQEVRRVGETFARKVDVRLVTAANRDMRAQVAADRFRADLLYRLDVIRIRIPPLRERPEDIAALVQHFWRQAAARIGSSATLSVGALTQLARYPWPGNVRELQNVMAALAVAGPPRGRVGASLLPDAIAGSRAVGCVRLADARAQFERRFVEGALARAGGSRTQAAVDLGLSRQGLQKTMVRLGIETPPEPLADLAPAGDGEERVADVAGVGDGRALNAAGGHE